MAIPSRGLVPATNAATPSPPVTATVSCPRAPTITGAAKSSTGCVRGARIRPTSPTKIAPAVAAKIAWPLRSLLRNTHTAASIRKPAQDDRTASAEKTARGSKAAFGSFQG